MARTSSYIIKLTYRLILHYDTIGFVPLGIIFFFRDFCPTCFRDIYPPFLHVGFFRVKRFYFMIIGFIFSPCFVDFFPPYLLVGFFSRPFLNKWNPPFNIDLNGWRPRQETQWR